MVDNASSDRSVEVARARARAHAGVTVRSRTVNVGYAVAMNDALAGSTAPVLLALNPDTELPPGSIARLVAELDRHPDAGLVVLDRQDVRPRHPKSRDEHDPLHVARAAELTSLWRLAAVEGA